MKILTISTFLFVFVTSVLSRSGLRDAGKYVTIDDVMYYIEDLRPLERYPFRPVAVEICTGLDMDLPDLETAEKEAAIVGYLKTVGIHILPFWTSGVRGDDGRWMWTNLGREMTYTNWGSGDPNRAQNFALYYTRYMIAEVAEVDLPLVICQEKPKGPGFTCKRRRRRANPT